LKLKPPEEQSTPIEFKQVKTNSVFSLKTEFALKARARAEGLKP